MKECFIWSLLIFIAFLTIIVGLIATVARELNNNRILKNSAPNQYKSRKQGKKNGNNDLQEQIETTVNKKGLSHRSSSYGTHLYILGSFLGIVSLVFLRNCIKTNCGCEIIPNPFQSNNCKNIIDEKPVTIHDEIWAVGNLDIKEFCDGTPIRQAKTLDDWKDCNDKKMPCWCYYDTLPENGEKYGVLYNGYAVDSIQKILPMEEWSLPYSFHVQKIKDEKAYNIPASDMYGNTGWKNHNGMSVKGTNSTGFTALPGGYCTPDFKFEGIDTCSKWWNLNYPELNKELKFYYRLNSDTLNHFTSTKDWGFYIRCIKVIK